MGGGLRADARDVLAQLGERHGPVHHQPQRQPLVSDRQVLGRAAAVPVQQGGEGGEQGGLVGRPGERGRADGARPRLLRVRRMRVVERQ